MPTPSSVAQFTVTDATRIFTENDISTILFITSNVPLDTINFVTGDYREYTSLTDVGVDFGTGSDIYAQVRSALSQQRKPSRWYIYVREANVAQVKTLTFTGTTLASGAKINGKINGLSIAEVPFDTDEAGTLADLDTAISNMIGVASVTVSGRVLTITAIAGYNLDISNFVVTGIANPPTASVATTTAGYTISDAINDFLVVKEDWYGLCITSTSLGTHDTAAREIEGLGSGLFFCNLSDADILANTANNFLAQQKARLMSRTAVVVHHIDSEYAGAALAAKALTYLPGEATLAWKDLISVTVSPKTEISTTEETNVLNNNGNVYKNIGNLPALWEGKCTDGGYIDNKINSDFLLGQLRAAVINAFANNSKISFTDAGLMLLGDKLKEVTDRAENPNRPILVKGKTFITVPKRADYTTIERGTRMANKFKISCEFAGAIHRFAAEISFSF